MKKNMLMTIAAIAVAAVAASCAPRAQTPVATAMSPTAAPVATGSPAASTTAADLRDLLMEAGLAVPQNPIPADDFALASLKGGTVKLSDYRGKVVFLNFWATWCPPCRSEMPSMERLHQLLRGKGLEMVAVDLQEPKDTVSTFIKENELTFTVLLDTSGAVGGAWGAQSIPTTYLIDRNGGILARSIGAREWDSPDMVALFDAILAAK